MSGTPRIAVVGSLNTDLTTFGDEYPRAGQTLFGRTFQLGFGGKGANQAVAGALCGAQVAMVGKVGRDLFGEATIRSLEALGVDASHVGIIDGVSTGVGSIFVEPTGQNRIVVVNGANDRLMPADVDAAADALRNADLIIVQFEVPLPTVYHTIRLARRHGIRCIVNPAPALAADIGELTAADYFIPNETEAERISGLSMRSIDDARACAAVLRSKGFRRVLVTLGERGSLLANETGSTLVPPFEVKAVDTSGAGDAFIGSLATFLAEGVEERVAVARANLYAALSTTRPGTQSSYPGRAAFEAEWVRRTGPAARIPREG